MDFGMNLKRARINTGLSQAQLAEMAGVSQTIIYQYETGKRKPKIETINKIADALNISVRQLTGNIEAHVNNAFKDSINELKQMDALVNEYPEIASSFPKLLEFLECYGVTFDYNTNEFIFMETGEIFSVDNQQMIQIPSIAAEQIKVLIKTLHSSNKKDEG